MSAILSLIFLKKGDILVAYGIYNCKELKNKLLCQNHI